MPSTNRTQKRTAASKLSPTAGKRKPGRQAATGKNQLLISRFFSAKSSNSKRNLTPIQSLVSNGAKRVKPPEPGTLLPSIATSPASVPSVPSYQENSDELVTLPSTTPSEQSLAKNRSSPAGRNTGGHSIEKPLPRKRERPSNNTRVLADEDSDDSVPPRKVRKNLARDRYHDADPDFDPHAQDGDSSACMTECDEEEYDSENRQRERVPEKAEQESVTQPPRSTLDSFGHPRSLQGDEQILPRDNTRKRRFHRKIWPLGGRKLELQWGEGSQQSSALDESGGAVKPKKATYTPLESQFVSLRKENPEMLLVIECGYKYRMFDSDASVASKVLRIAAYFDRNFLTASFPTHRLSYHVNRLVQAGYKVGVVNQSETAALKKASSKASGLFQRKLTSVYTRGTMVVDGTLLPPGSRTGDGSGTAVRSSTIIMAVFETKQGRSHSLPTGANHTAFAAVDTTDGQISWDSFTDDVLRSELLSKLTALEPVEILMSAKMSSQQTELLIKEFSHKSGARIERLSESCFAKTDLLSKLNGAVEGLDTWDGDSQKLLVGCFGALHTYLIQFGLESFMTNATQNMASRRKRQMSLGSDVLRNFEVLGNSNNGAVHGSLLELLNRTKTNAGSRLMRQWLCHPLISRQDIIDRLDAVEYLRESMSDRASEHGLGILRKAISCLISSLTRFPDLEQSLLRITCQKCRPSEFIDVIQAFEEIGTMVDEIKKLLDPSVLPRLLHDMLSSTPNVSELLSGDLISHINRSAAADDTYHDVFSKLDSGSELCPNPGLSQRYTKSVMHLIAVNTKLAEKTQFMDELLDRICAEYALSPRNWKRVAKEEFLLEVSISEATAIPRSWPIISQTKSVKRFRPPEAVAGYEAILCLRERRDAHGLESWKVYLELFAAVASPLRCVVRTLVHLDCLSALGAVADLSGYSKPQITLSENAPSGIEADNVRHPLTEASHACSGYVPNDIELGKSQGRLAMVISGPNYGGKSSYARMTALVVILAQVGSYVPASRVVLSPFDSIYARMGSSDSIATGMSSLMVELAETSRILRNASSRSLVVIDELGRGTSTHDGTAIACASLAYLLEEVQCVTLFITHYPPVTALGVSYPERLGAFYMDYREDSNGGERLHSKDANSRAKKPTEQVKITLLYKMTKGVAGSSYGLNVARIAGLDGSVIEHAKEKALGLENKLKEASRCNSLARLLCEASWRSGAAFSNAIKAAED